MNTLPPEIQYEIAILLDVDAVRALMKSKVMNQEALDLAAIKVGQDLVKSLDGKVFYQTRPYKWHFESIYIVKSINVKNGTLVIKSYCQSEMEVYFESFNQNCIVCSKSRGGEETTLKHLEAVQRFMSHVIF